MTDKLNNARNSTVIRRKN